MPSILPSPNDCCEPCECEEVIVPPSGDVVGWYNADTLIEARTFPSVTTNKVLMLNGELTAGDGFGGSYYWDPALSGPENFAITIAPNDAAGLGQWHKLG